MIRWNIKKTRAKINKSYNKRMDVLNMKGRYEKIFIDSWKDLKRSSPYIGYQKYIDFVEEEN
jgi:acyl-CoA-binding protein